MFEFDAERVRANVRQATTEDLLDRVTVSREGMEPEALDIIEGELRRRGVTPQDLEAHASRYRRQSTLPAGERPPPRCAFCDRPAVRRAWGWRRLGGRERAGLLGVLGFLLSLLPLYRPGFFYSCAAHGPAAKEGGPTSARAGEPRPPG